MSLLEFVKSLSFPTWNDEKLNKDAELGPEPGSKDNFINGSLRAYARVALKARKVLKEHEAEVLEELEEK